MDFRCRLCGEVRGSPVLTKGALQLARCATCALVQQSPLPQAIEYDGRYADAGSYGTQLLPHKQLFLTATAPSCANCCDVVPAALCSTSAPARASCSKPRAPRAAKRSGWSWRKPSVEQIRKLGFPVHACGIEQAPLAPGSVGAVTFAHSLEHLLDPVGALRAAGRLLRQDPGAAGYVHVAVPHWRAAKRWFAGAGIAWIFPEHISYFTPRTLALAFDRAGFDVVAMRTRPMVCDADYRFAITALERFRLDGLVRRFLHLGERRLDALLGNDLQLACPVWRLRAVNGATRALLRLWPERLWSWLGCGEELRATARRRASATRV